MLTYRLSLYAFRRWLCLLIIPILCFSGCESKEVTIPGGAFDEKTIDLQGTWKISRVLLNGTEITDKFDFTGFALTLNMSGGQPAEFQINNASAPFVVINNGTWSYNDPVYPTSMKFNTGFDEGSVQFLVPPISTGSEMSISFSLGCHDNTYVYEFGKQSK